VLDTVDSIQPAKSRFLVNTAMKIPGALKAGNSSMAEQVLIIQGRFCTRELVTSGNEGRLLVTHSVPSHIRNITN
jgi:hypothetical protein